MSVSEGNWTVRLDGSTLPDRALIGGKGWSIARLCALGLPTSPAVTATTEACRAYMATGDLPAGLMDELRSGLDWIEQETGRIFGGAEKPLLISVRSGAPVSMPGMMDTVLNLGITDQAENALAVESGDAVFAHDTHRRFYELYASIVLKAALGELDAGQSTAEWREQVKAAAGTAIPESAEGQLEAAVRAVFDSWNSRRAKRYRAHNGIPDELGTAVSVQAMVFGNLDQNSGTGVLFSRNPLSGDPGPFGEYLSQAQGEDVVSGKVTPEPLSALASAHPDVHEELMKASDVLERENGDVQDIEFTVQQGKLYLLQSRSAKRSPAAAVRFAVDFVNDGRLSKREALDRVTPEQIRTLLRPRLDGNNSDLPVPIATGEAACPGVGVGVVVGDADAAEAEAAKGNAVILVRPTTSPEDVHGMVVAEAVVTEQGGATSHAAVVSRALGLPCVVGCGDGVLQGLDSQTVTVDGDSGRVFGIVLPVKVPDENHQDGIGDLITWARDYCPLTVVGVGQPLPSGLQEDSVIDLDHTPGGEDPDNLEDILRGARAARGGALNSDEGVAHAISAGLETIVVRHELPALLAAISRDAGPDQD